MTARFVSRLVRVALVAIGLAGAASISACKPPQADDDSILVVTGSSTVAPIAAEVARQFELERGGVRVDVQSGGSSRGIGDVRRGLAQIGMVSRALKGTEQQLETYTIARDGVGLIVNAANPLDALDAKSVVALYRGEISDWSELGGESGRPVIVHKAAGRATLEVFVDHFGLEPGAVAADVIVGENEQAIKTVAGNPDAIGYVSIGTAAVDIDAGVPIKLLVVDGVEASLANVRSGAYPISRPLNLVTREPAEGLTLAFIDYVRSAAAEDVFEAQAVVQVVQ